MTPPLELTSSWSLRSHYSRDLADRRFGSGREGHAICNEAITVFEEKVLLGYGFAQDRLNRRPMCKRCERLSAA